MSCEEIEKGHVKEEPFKAFVVGFVIGVVLFFACWGIYCVIKGMG